MVEHGVLQIHKGTTLGVVLQAGVVESANSKDEVSDFVPEYETDETYGALVFHCSLVAVIFVVHKLKIVPSKVEKISDLHKR